MMTPGELMASEARARLDRLAFYVESLTNIERSKLAARYLRKHSPQDQRFLLKRLTVAQLALCQVFSVEIYGW